MKYQKPKHRHDWVLRNVAKKRLMLYPAPIPFQVDKNGNMFFDAGDGPQYGINVNDKRYMYVGVDGGTGLPLGEAMQVMANAQETYDRRSAEKVRGGSSRRRR